MKTSKTSGASKNIKDMFHQASPAIAPTTPGVQPAAAPTSSPAKVTSEPSAMEVDPGVAAELAVVDEQATQESTASKVAEAPTKDATGSSKAMVEGGTSAAGGVTAPRTPAEFPKIVYPVLTPSSSTLVPGAASTSPTCGLEELLKQADILRENSLAFSKILAESATNLKIIALVNFVCLLHFIYSIPL